MTQYERRTLHDRSARIAGIGAIVCGLGVALGAFGAHGLQSVIAEWYPDANLAERRFDNWETAVKYQMYHGLGLLALGLGGLFASAHGRKSRIAIAVATLGFLGGVTIFSGCLYLLVLTDLRALGAIVPIGGVASILGWAATAWLFWILASQRREGELE